MQNTIGLEELVNGELPVWLRKATGVPLSTTVVLHRNIKGCKFVHKAKADDLKELSIKILKAVQRLPGSERLSYSLASIIEPAVKGVIYERCICDTVLMEAPWPGVVVVSKNGEVGIHVNAVDHLEISVSKPGLSVSECIKSANFIADNLGLAYAKTEAFGHLTTMPALMGTGLDVRMKIHIPGLVLEQEPVRWMTYAKSLGVITTGFFGPDSDPFGNIFSLRNQNTHRKTEKDIIDVFGKVIAHVTEAEEKATKDYDPQARMDAIARAFGMLSYVHQIDFDEAMSGLSLIRLGINIGMIDNISHDALSRLIFNIFPTQVQQKTSCPPDEIKSARATLIREALSN